MGVAIAGLTTSLILTSFGLYYIGSDIFRGWASDLHIVLGLAFPAMLTAHVVAGKQRSSPHSNSKPELLKAGRAPL
jgi:hypothetical protein